MDLITSDSQQSARVDQAAIYSLQSERVYIRYLSRTLPKFHILFTILFLLASETRTCNLYEVKDALAILVANFCNSWKY